MLKCTPDGMFERIQAPKSWFFGTLEHLFPPSGPHLAPYGPGGPKNIKKTTFLVPHFGDIFQPKIRLVFHYFFEVIFLETWLLFGAQRPPKLPQNGVKIESEMELMPN